MKVADRLSQLPPRLQRVLALLTLPAVLLVIWVGFIWPIQHTYEAQLDWRETATRTLARQRGLADIEPTVRAQLAGLPHMASWQRLYPASADNAAAVALQTDISTTLATSNARPQSFTPLEASRWGPLRKFGLRVVAPMSIDQLREFLRRARELPHFVRIERLLVTAPPMQSPQENPTLLVTLEIAAFRTSE